MTRIAIISIRGTSLAGGVERVVAHHKALLEREHSVRVFSIPEEGLLARLCRRFPLVERAVIVLFPLISWIPARAWAGRDGIVLSHGYSSVGMSCDAVFAHGCWAAYARAAQLRRGTFGLFAHAYEWLAAHLARKIVAVSDTVAKQWMSHYGLRERNSRVLINTVDLSVHRPLREDATVCAEAQLRVLFVGRLEVAKGLAYLEALHGQLERRPTPVGVCVCSPVRPSPEVVARFPGFEIRFRLDARALVAEYNRADLFLLPSRYEAFELSSIEALACGTPVMLNPTGARPILERLRCPAVYRLESAASPLAAIEDAAARFRGITRKDVAAWTALHFDGRSTEDQLAALLRELGR